MLALSLFGVTSGLKVRTHGQDFAFNIPDEWIELSPSVLRLGPDDQVVIVSRFSTDVGVLTWVGLYRPAIEIASERTGGCFGAGFWLLGKVAQGSLMLRALGLFADQLKSLAMSDGRFVRTIESIEDSLNWHSDLGKQIQASLVNLNLGTGLGMGDLPRAYMNLAGYSNPDYPGWMIDMAQAGAGMAEFRTVMIGTERSMAETALRGGRLTMVLPAEWFQAQAANEAKVRLNAEVLRQKLEVTEHSLATIRSERDEAVRRLTARDAHLIEVRQQFEKLQHECHQLESRFGVLLEHARILQTSRTELGNRLDQLDGGGRHSAAQEQRQPAAQGSWEQVSDRPSRVGTPFAPTAATVKSVSSYGSPTGPPGLLVSDPEWQSATVSGPPVWDGFIRSPMVQVDVAGPGANLHQATPEPAPAPNRQAMVKNVRAQRDQIDEPSYFADFPWREILVWGGIALAITSILLLMMFAVPWSSFHR